MHIINIGFNAVIFEVTPEHIERLSDEDLRILVGYLSEQEVARAGHSPSGVTYGGNQNAKDGGIDVRVDLGAKEVSGFIPRPQTGFQVKADDMPKGAINEEMRPKGRLRPSIVELGENGGAYIIVSSKGSVADTALTSRKNAMASSIADEANASELHLDFYDRRRLATWVNQHPCLIPWVRVRVGQPLSGWRPYEDWSSSPSPMAEAYFTDDHVRIIGARLKETGSLGVIAGIEKIREALVESKSAVRLVGLSGVGKTRLIQALFDQAIGENALDPRLAVYTDLSNHPDPVPLELLEHLNNLGKRCILIVDNCGADLHRKLSARMRNATTEVSFVTVEYDISDDQPEHTDTFKLEPASAEIIEKIIGRRYPDLAQPEVRIISEFSEGNSRIALALADTAQHGESLANLKDSELIRRLFHQNHKEDPALLRAARACSLVYSFEGVELSEDNAELPRIAALAGMGAEDFHAHIAELARRQLVQKRSSWRALLPHALAHKLAREALQDFPPERIHQKLVASSPERLFKSYSRRLGCLHDSPEARSVIAQWLGKDGFLEKIEELDTLGIVVLENVAPVSPEAVLGAIEMAIQRGKIAYSQLSGLERIVGILRSLAYEPEMFNKAASLLVKLTEGETESNNVGAAANVFKSLFYLHLSGTHADARQRADVLRLLSESSCDPEQTLVLSGLDAMLECNHFSSGYSFEFGTRKRDFGYHPRTYGDLWNWYKEGLALAGDLAEQSHLRTPVRNMIAAQFRYLATALQVTDALVDLADKFSADDGWPEGWAGVRSALAILKKENRDVDVTKLSALEGRLRPKTLKARIASYVLPDQWGALDIAELDFEDEKRYEKARKKAEELCDAIGRELAADLAGLEIHLPSMLGSTSARVSTVALAIGRESQEPRKAWELILAAALSSACEMKGSSFLGAFLSGLSKTNRVLCEELLDEALGNTALHPFFVHMQAWVGVDQAGKSRLIEALNHKTVPVHTFGRLAGGRVCDGLSASNFNELLLSVATRDDGLNVALEILHMRLFGKRADKQAIEDAERAAGCELLRAVTFDKRNRHEAHILCDLVRECLISPAQEGVANLICQRLRRGIAQLHVYASDFSNLVAELGSRFPRSVLNFLVEQADDGLETRWVIFRDFRENSPCPLRMIPDDVLLDWVHERPETRFLNLAEVIRPWQRADRSVSDDNGSEDETVPMQWTSAAIRILREAPQPLEILNKYVDGLRPRSYGGSLASILESRLPLLNAFINDPKPELARAAETAIGKMKEDIAFHREREAQVSRERDERFEW